MVKIILATIYFTIAFFLFAIVTGYSIAQGDKITPKAGITYLVLSIIWPITLLGVICSKH